jgi:hypothetical protein
MRTREVRKNKTFALLNESKRSEKRKKEKGIEIALRSENKLGY